MIFNKEYILYMKDTVKLIKSLVIKSDVTVTSLNALAESIDYTIQYDNPTTYPYYQNLSGIYHTINKPMFITSLDSLATIPFKRDVLLKHKNTLREYQKLGLYFDELYEKNPDQELLIRGILNPIPYDISVPAKQGTILSYNKTLIEDNEYDLIPELQAFIYIFFDNWYNYGYTYTDELYDASFFGVLASTLVSKVMSIRLNKCGTSQVHSFHLWSKLGSHFHLDRYRDYIPYETAMWLYRNIDDIRFNLGKQHTFEKLIKNIFTNNSIPTSQLILMNDERVLDKNYYPDPYIYKQPINTYNTGIINDNILSTNTTINKMLPLAEHNPINIDYDIDDTNIKSIYSRTSTNDTKVFETILGLGNNINTTQFISDTINYLAYTIFNGIYSRNMVIKNNKGELVKVSIQEAFIIWIYIAHKLNWIEFDIVPQMVYKMMPRTPYGSYQDYRKAAHYKYVDDIEIKTAMLLLEPSSTINDSEEFSSRLLKYVNNKYMHFMMYATRQELNSYIRTKQMIDMFYINGMCECKYTGMSYVDFFDKIGLSVDSYEHSYLELLYMSMYEDMTGFDYGKIGSITNKQSKLVEVVKLLSSYTIQFITQETTNTSGSSSNIGAIKCLRMSDASIAINAINNVISPNITLHNKIQSRNYTEDIKLVTIKIKEYKIAINYSTRINSMLTIHGRGDRQCNVNVGSPTLRLLPKRSYSLLNYLPNNKLNGLQQISFNDSINDVYNYINGDDIINDINSIDNTIDDNT